MKNVCYATEIDYIKSMLNNKNIKYIETVTGNLIEIKIDNNIGYYLFKNQKLIEQKINLPGDL